MPDFNVSKKGEIGSHIGIIFDDADPTKWWGSREDRYEHLHITFFYSWVGEELFEKTRKALSIALKKEVGKSYEKSKKFGQRDNCLSFSFTNPVEIFLAATKLRELFLTDEEFFISSDAFVNFEKQRLSAWKNAVAYAKKRLEEMPAAFERLKARAEEDKAFLDKFYPLDEKGEEKDIEPKGCMFHVVTTFPAFNDPNYRNSYIYSETINETVFIDSNGNVQQVFLEGYNLLFLSIEDVADHVADLNLEKLERYSITHSPGGHLGHSHRLPILIKQGDKYKIYGFTDKNGWCVTDLGSAPISTEYESKATSNPPKVTCNPVENAQLYAVIAAKKAHSYESRLARVKGILGSERSKYLSYDQLEVIRENGGHLHSSNELYKELRKEYRNRQERSRKELEAEQSMCEDMFARYGNSVDFCEDSLNAYVAIGEQRTANVARKCAQNLANLDEKLINPELFKQAGARPLRARSGVPIAQALFDQDPFHFLALPALENKLEGTVLESKDRESSLKTRDLGDGIELQPLRRQVKLSTWDVFREWVGKQFAKTSVFFKVASLFASDETLAVEGNAQAQFNLGLKFKATSRKDAKHWLQRAALTDNPTIRAAACYQLASLYINDYNDSQNYDALDFSSEWCRRAILVDGGKGLKEFLNNLFSSYVNKISLGNDVITVANFLADRSNILRVAMLQHKWREFTYGSQISSLVYRSDKYSQNKEVWDDVTACQAVEILATLPADILKQNFSSIFDLHNHFYASPRACALILTKPALMVHIDKKDSPEYVGALLNDASQVVADLVHKSPKQIPPELTAYIKYAEKTDLTKYNSCVTGLRGLSHEAVIWAIVTQALGCLEYRKLLDSVYSKENSFFTAGVDKPAVFSDIGAAKTDVAALGASLGAALGSNKPVEPPIKPIPASGVTCKPKP